MHRVVAFCMYFLGLIVICYSLFLASTMVRLGDLGFNTDLARDFLLLEDAVNTHKLPLIGPRSGGISGIFHGPLWLYINLPAYLLGHGNPLAVGWFWVGLLAITIGITFFVGKKLFSSCVGMCAAVLISLLLIPSASTLFNPFGAVIISPLFSYTFLRYTQTRTWPWLAATLFLVGCIIQFQIAFGGPMLILLSLYTGVIVVKHKLFRHLFSFLILLIPLSTYILFEVRHQFLQTHALLAYLQHKAGSSAVLPVIQLIHNRWVGISDSVSFIPYAPAWIGFLVGGAMVIGLVIILLKKNLKHRNIYLLFLYFFVGYWIFAFLFRGVIWSYYYWAFQPLIIIMFSSYAVYLKKFIFIPLYGVIFFFLFQGAMQNIPTKQYVGRDSGSWLFNKNAAENVYKDAPDRFGYFIFSPDEYGYSPRYAMHFVGKEYPQKHPEAFKKAAVTYLLISPPGGDHLGVSGNWWVINKIHITKSPEQTWTLPNGFRIEKYGLTPDEIMIPADANLITDLTFR